MLRDDALATPSRSDPEVALAQGWEHPSFGAVSTRDSIRSILLMKLRSQVVYYQSLKVPF